MAEAARINSTVYVAGLAHEVDQAILHGAFLPFGEIAEVSLPKPELRSSTEAHRGFGYVEFEDSSDAEAAIDNMDGAELYGKVLHVAAARPQKRANEGLGAKTAIWQQVRLVQDFEAPVQCTDSPSRKAIWRSMPSARSPGRFRIDLQYQCAQLTWLTWKIRCRDSKRLT